MSTYSFKFLWCRWAAGGEEVQFYKAAKRLTFSAACRAAIGDVLSRQELDQLFPTAVTLGNGVFSVVRPPLSLLVLCACLTGSRVMPYR